MPKGITLSEAAIAATRMLEQGEPAYRNLSLRCYIAGKQCDGFEYGVTFDHAQADDHHFPCAGIDVVVDPTTLGFIDGTSIDWVDDERGRGFVLANPNHRKFRGKFYKLKTWQNRLAPVAEANETQLK